MKTPFFLLAISLTTLLCACSVNKYSRNNKTVEPAVNKAVEELSNYGPAKEYVAYFKKNPARINYRNDNYICSSYDFKNGIILIPRQLDSSQAAMKIEIMKSLYLWKIHNQYRLEEFMNEEAVMAEILALRYFFDLGLGNKDLTEDTILSKLMTKNVCIFISMSGKIFLNNAQNKYLSSLPACGWPLETLNKQKIWFGRLKNALQDGSFIRLIDEANLEKVKKHIMTAADAARESALLRSKTTYEIYRQYRGYSDISLEKLSKFEKEYLKTIENFMLWEKSYAEQIENARYDYLVCSQD